MKPRVGDCSLQNKCTLVIHNCKNRISEKKRKKKKMVVEEEKIFKPFIFANQDMRSKNEKNKKDMIS